MIEEVITFKFAKDWLPKLYKNLVGIYKERENEITRMSDVFEDPLELAKTYVEPDCQQFNPADDDEHDSNVIRIPAFKYIEDTFLCGAKKTGGKNILFILSDAGMGKTSLLSILWLSYINSFWPKKYKCTLLKLGNSTLQEIKRISNKKEHILLLDGLDEDPLAWSGVERRIRNILQASDGFYRVILTCRTQFFSGGSDPFNRRGHVEVAGYICPVVYLSLFNDSQVNQYLERKFNHDKSINFESIKKIKHLISKMGKLRCRPMLLAHAEDLVQSENNEWDEYSVYNALIYAWLHRERRKKVWETIDYPPTVSDLLEAARSVAFTIQKSGAASLESRYLEKLVANDKNAKNITFMDIGGRSFLNKNSKGEFRFSHRSIQEYLLAQGVVENKFQDTKSVRGSDQIVKFVITWLAANRKHINGFPWNAFNLKSISFRGYNLSRYDFRDIDLRDVDLSGSNLEKANLKGADIRGADLRNVNLKGTNLKGVIHDKSTKWPEDHGTTIFGYFIGPKTFLKNAELYGLELDRCDMHSAKLINTKFVNCNMQNIELRDSTLLGVTIKDSDLFQADFSMSEIMDSDFSGITGAGSVFSFSVIHNTSYIGSDIPQSKFEKSEINSCDFSEANLYESFFEGGSIENTSFNHSDLRGISDLDTQQENNNDYFGTVYEESIEEF